MSVPQARESGERFAPTGGGFDAYFADAPGRNAGPLHDRIVLFTDTPQTKRRFEIEASEADLIAALLGQQGDTASAPSPALERAKLVRLGPVYQTVSRQFDNRSRSVRDMIGRNFAAFADNFPPTKAADPHKPNNGFDWQESTRDLFGRLAASGRNAAADSHWIAFSRYFSPGIEIGFDLTRPASLAGAFPLVGDELLYSTARQFFANIQTDGRLKRLFNRYIDAEVRLPNKIDVSVFHERIQTLLPRYRELFQEAEEATGLDWRLLASVGYQESHWDPLATSPTGVRGLMMLTEETAGRLKIRDRLDPRESILAGARYLVLLKEGIPARIREPDRTWFAVAAYNQGPGHLEDARILARRLKRSADSWADVKTAMPLLSDPEHHNTLKHGYARGNEAVTMTESVRTYFDALVRLEKPYQPVTEVESSIGGGEETSKSEPQAEAVDPVSLKEAQEP